MAHLSILRESKSRHGDRFREAEVGEGWRHHMEGWIAFLLLPRLGEERQQLEHLEEATGPCTTGTSMSVQLLFRTSLSVGGTKRRASRRSTRICKLTAVAAQERDGIGFLALALLVDEVDLLIAESLHVDGGQELRVLVQPRFLLPPVETFLPVGDQPLDIIPRHPVVPVVYEPHPLIGECC